MCKIVKTYFNLEAKSNLEFFLIFHVSSSVCDKNNFIKKGATGLVFKVHAIDGKKWVKFIAMQQNSRTLNDLNTTKGAGDSYLTKKIE